MSAVPRMAMSKGQAERAYKKALIFLEPRHPWRVHGLREMVRILRAEAKGWRHVARNAQREVELLKIQLDEARRGTHE